ncbi:MAG: hypothetical protein BAA04_00085 [Firmicutes bacterium ZCTH02-B6]|nr:MAG: hypothetical protein BAA04_00085 [Firmicutes bacterium ZCTH02-B6]
MATWWWRAIPKFVPDDVAAAKAAALRLLAARARSAQELERRLLRRGFAPAVVAEVVAWCHGLGYLDDEQFAEDWIRARVGRYNGRRRIEHELREKGIPRDVVRRKLAELVSDEDELASCLELARRQYSRVGDLPPEVRRRRVSGFLLRRGFSPEAVQRALAQVDSDYESH